MEKKVALITGITGQDGSYLAEFLLDKGYEVHGTIRRSSVDFRERIAHLEGRSDFHLHYADMSDSMSLVKLIGSVKPTEIYNLAAQSHVQVSFDAPEFTADVVNGEGDVEVALNEGRYDIAVEYVDDNYENNVTSIPFTVSKADVALTVEVLDKVYTADVSGIVFASADGEYKVVIGNYEILVIVKDGVGSFDVGILSVGNYTASVSFNGTDNYNSANNETAFEVTQTGTNFNIIANSSEIAYGGAVEIAQGLPGDATGSVTYSFANGTVIQVVGVNESFVLSGLNAGSYVVYADYSGDGNYAPAQDSIAISVSKVDVAVSVVVLDKVYTADVNGNVFASVDGEYKVIIGNYETQVIVKDGVGSFDVGILNVGNYVAYVSFVGDDNYNSANNETAFEVTQTGTNFNIIVNSSEISYGGAVEIAQGLPGDATGSVTYSFANGTVIRVVGVNESFVLSGLNAGSYVVYADYSGDGNYAPAQDSIAISVSKGDIKLIVIVFDVIYPQEVNGVVYSSVDGEFNLTIGNYSTIVAVNNRLCEFNLGVLDVGDYSGTVSYPGDLNHNPAQSVFSFKVDDIPLVAPMASEFGEITIGDDQSVSIVLKDEDGNAIANAQITYVVNGKAGNVTTDGDGKFTIMGENGATITVNYDGNETIAGTNMTLKLHALILKTVQ